MPETLHPGRKAFMGRVSEIPARICPQAEGQAGKGCADSAQIIVVYGTITPIIILSLSSKLRAKNRGHKQLWPHPQNNLQVADFQVHT